MRLHEIERLKRDRKETQHYQRSLQKKGKDTHVYKMQKKIEYLSDYINELSRVS
jgi:uncharacterized membrane protein (DUF106 family)